MICILEHIDPSLNAIFAHSPHATFDKFSPSMKQPLQSLLPVLSAKRVKNAMLEKLRE
jgi:hypothetical protein